MKRSTPLSSFGIPAKLRQEDQKQRDDAQAQREEEWTRANNFAKSQHPSDFYKEMELTQVLSGNTRR